MISHLETAGIGAKCQLRRALGQPYSTDHDTLTDDLIPQVGFEVSP